MSFDLPARHPPCRFFIPTRKETMSTIVLKFETDPQMGVPRLHPVGETGRKSPWNARDLRQIEEQLRSRYETLVRDGSGTLHVLGRTFQVRKQAGDTSRQPTLELYTAEGSAESSPALLSSAKPPDPPAVRAVWFPTWLDDVERLIDSDRLVRTERIMLDEVVAELRVLSTRLSPPALSHLLFTAVVSLADQLSRLHEPGQPHPYPFALSGLERIQDAEPVPPWGQFTTAISAKPPRSWVGHFWHKLKCR